MSSTTLGLESQSLLLDLYGVLQTLDPARWRDELAPAVREALARLSTRARAVAGTFDRPLTDPRLERVRLRLRQLAAEMEDAAARLDASADRLRAEWAQVRVRLTMAYEDLASSLRALRVRVPGVRQTNRARTTFHVVSGLVALLLVEHVLDRRGMIAVTFAWTAWAWSMELTRKRIPPLNRVLVWMFGRMVHPRELHGINSATWYGTALFLLALTMPVPACAVALVVLAVADPVAAAVGRRFGRIRIRSNRTLEGSLAFAASGLAAAFAVLQVYHPEPGPASNLALAAGASLCATLAEAYSVRLDDNFTVPLAAALGTAATAWLLLS